MTYKNNACLFFPFFLSFLYSQIPDTLWTKTYGGSGYDYCSAVRNTDDWGYIMAGETNSYGAGGYDIWVIKTDMYGDTIWTKTYGDVNDDRARSIQQTSDYGYIIAGSKKNLANIIHVHLIKTDPFGDTLWTKMYGDTSVAYSIQETSDSGYIVAGSVFTGRENGYLIKTDSNGDTLWTKTYGSWLDDWFRSVKQTSDGGYVIVGAAEQGSVTSFDLWLLKTDANGDTLWTKKYGGSSWDYGFDVVQTVDGGYTIIGTTSSFGAGLGDVWLLRTDANGDTLWTRTFGGSGSDWGRSIQQCSNGGYIISGYTNSYGSGSNDIYLIKTNANGNILWSKTYGDINSEYSMSVQQTPENGYIVAGYTYSFGSGLSDVWLLKIDTDTYGIVENQIPNTKKHSLAVYPNPFWGKIKISFQTYNEGYVNIAIYDITGRIIKNFPKTILQSSQSINLFWAGRDNDEHIVPNGIYFLKLEARESNEIKKLVFTR